VEPLRQPVVLVDIEGDSVRLNGALIERVDDADPWIVGIQAVCSTVAVPLGRPVWALVSEPGGQTRLAVHPDGGISHVTQVDPPAAFTEALALAATAPDVPEATFPALQLIETDEPEADDPEADEPEAEVPEADVPQAVVPEPAVPEPSRDQLAAFLAASARAQKHGPHRPLPGQGHRGAPRPHPVAHRVTPVLGVAAMVAVALAAAMLVTRGGDEPPTAQEQTTQAAGVKGVLPSADRARLSDRFPRDLDVHVIPHAASVEIRVEASRLPVRAVIVLNPVNGSRVERSVILRTAVTQLHLDELPAGSVDWTVRVAGAHTSTGSVLVPEAPTETPTTTAPAAPTTPQEPSDSTSTTPSEPLTPIDPDEPTGPVDPDDL
jgi:hypothetical protein